MGDSSPAPDDVNPPWASLAAEKYLLQQWQSDSSESPGQQRRKLVRQYVKAGPERKVSRCISRMLNALKAGVIEPVGSYVSLQALIDHSRTESPTAAQISTILQPWRTPAQRDIARQGSINAAWLRTCYSPGSDEKHEALVEYIDMELAIDGDGRLLNDPELYSFGPNWQQVFDVFPELLEPEDGYWDYLQEQQHESMEALKAFAEGGVSRAPFGLLENLSSLQGQELEDYLAMFLQSSVHAAYVKGWVVLEDEEALNTGKPVLMFLDTHGRVVRSMRVLAGDAAGMGGLWLDGSWRETTEWEDGDLGEEYKKGGACEGLLLEIVRSA